MLYVRYPLSLWNVENLWFERAYDLCHETVRLWWKRFGPMFAADIRRRRVSRIRSFCHWRWYLDETYVKLNGEVVYLWRAVDHEGEILKSYVTKKRDKTAALVFIKQALKRHGKPDTIVTDGLRSYPAAMREISNLDSRQNAPLEEQSSMNSHLPFRRRNWAMPAISADEDAAEIRIRPRLTSRPFQFRTPARRPPNLQATPLGRAGPVTIARQLIADFKDQTHVGRRVRIRLTAPVQELKHGL